MEVFDIVDSGVAAVLFVATFLVGDRVRPLRRITSDRRSLVSFASGVSAAYVFVDVLPELGVAREVVRSADVPTPYEGMSLYVIALFGFMVFYGLHHLRSRKSELEPVTAYRIHLGGFVVYAAMTSYLLVRGLEEIHTTRTFYALAMAAHLLAIDHSLHDERPPTVAHFGRRVLAGACMVGWALAIVVPVPAIALAIVLAFVAGSVIVNSAVTELPSEGEGRFGPFVAGGLIYAVVLIVLT